MNRLIFRKGLGCVCTAFFVLASLFSFTAVRPQEVIEAPVQPTPVPMRSVLRGFVFYEDSGRPIKRTSVILLPSEKGAGQEASGVTDNNGKIEFRNVKAGRYFAVVNAPGVVSPIAYANLQGPRDDFVNDEINMLPSITVDGLSDQEIPIAARRGGAISGRVSYPEGDPAIGVSVSVLRKVGDDFVATIPNFSALGSMMTGGAGTFQTDDRGAFRFSGLPAGEYLVKITENVEHAKSPRSRSMPFESLLFGSGSMVSMYFKDVFEKEKAELLRVEFGVELAEINLTLPNRALKNIAGKVVSAKDKLPVRGARVNIKAESEPEEANDYRMAQTRIGYTDKDGKFEFVELPTGKYTITVVAENSHLDAVAKAYGYDPDPDTGFDAVSNANRAMQRAINALSNVANSAGSGGKPPRVPKFASRSIEVEIGGDKELPEQNVELNFGAVISGTVTVEKGDLPSMITVSSKAEGDGIALSDNIYTYEYSEDSRSMKRTGDFEIEAVPAGKRLLSVSITDDSFYVKSAMAGSRDLLSGPFEIKEGEDLLNVKIVLSKDVGTLKGKVVDTTKQPVVGYEFTLVPTDKVKMLNAGFYRTVKSRANGEFELKLAPGEYSILRMTKAQAKMSAADRNRWLIDRSQAAQKVKIEPEKTETVTLENVADPPK